MKPFRVSRRHAHWVAATCRVPASQATRAPPAVPTLRPAQFAQTARIVSTGVALRAGPQPAPSDVVTPRAPAIPARMDVAIPREHANPVPRSRRAAPPVQHVRCVPRDWNASTGAAFPAVQPTAMDVAIRLGSVSRVTRRVRAGVAAEPASNAPPASTAPRPRAAGCAARRTAQAAATTRGPAKDRASASANPERPVAIAAPTTEDLFPG
jgi:hypothetical protein